MSTSRAPGFDRAGGSTIACIVPTHGRSARLLAALDSIAQQRVPVERVVVVDDLAEPDTEAAVGAWAASAPFPVSYVADADRAVKSAGASRNRGALESSAAFLAFLEDDDYWEPEFLDRTLEAIEGDGTDMAVAWAWHERGAWREPGPAMPAGLRAAEVLAVNPGFTGSNFVIRGESFKRVSGFDAELPVGNDLDFLVRFLDADQRYSVVPDRLVHKVAHDDGQLTAKTERRARGLETYLAKHGDRMSRSGRREWLRSIHNTRRATATGIAGRLRHLVAEVWYSSPKQLVVGVGKALTNRRDVYQ